MSDGTIRYLFEANNLQGVARRWYLQFTSAMSVTGGVTPTPTASGIVTIQYNANGGSGAPSRHHYTKDNNGVIRFNLSTTVPTRSGFVFQGWRLDNSTAFGIDSPGQSITINTGRATGNETLTYFAQWVTARTYTLTYNANGGTGAPQSQTITENERWIISSVVPTRTGFTFEGWSTLPNARHGFLFPGDSYLARNNTTLYATWSAVAAIPAAPNVSFFGMSSGPNMSFSVWGDTTYINTVFICEFHANSDQPITEQGFVLLSNTHNQIASMSQPVPNRSTLQERIVLFSGSFTVTGGQTGNFNYVYHLTPLEVGRTYFWYVYVISNGQRVESPMQSFVYA